MSYKFKFKRASIDYAQTNIIIHYSDSVKRL
jgi:hypothetical protein